MNQPIYDPIMPCMNPLQERFRPGRVIRLQGSVPSVSDKFHIGLQCGPHTLQDDIALQISVHICDGYTEVNSFQNGQWDEEQRIHILPIKRAQRFEIILKCEFSLYKIFINGQHFCDFPQRIHYDRITHLAISGDVSISQIRYGSDSPHWTNPSIALTEPTATTNPSQSPSNRLLPSSPALDPPPSYEAAVHGFSENVTTPSSNRSYTPSATHPIDSSPVRPPYPLVDPTDMPNPTRTTSSTYISSWVPRARPPPPPPLNAPAPLNVHQTLNIVQAPRKGGSSPAAVRLILFVIFVIVAIAIIVIKTTKPKSSG